MRRAILFLGLLILTVVPSQALLQQRSFGFFLKRSERYVDRPITMGCSSVHRMPSKAEQASGVVLFDAFTVGDDGSRRTLVAVPAAEADSFDRRYNISGRYGPRPLTGVLKRKPKGFYVSYEGALLPDATRGSEPDAGGADPGPAAAPVPFDTKPMVSFSYQGQRLIEASVKSVDASGVTVRSKDGISVVVPIAEAKKIPDLRMRARAAMEAVAPNPTP
jgi:hypothetical protein